MARHQIDQYYDQAREAALALRTRVPITSAVLDFWGGAVRIIYGSPEIAVCASACAECALFRQVGPDAPDAPSQGFVATLVQASQRQLETFPAKQKHLNCKTLDQYLDAFVTYLVIRCDTEAAIQAELDLVRGFRILYLADNSDLPAAEHAAKAWVVEETLRRMAPADQRRETVARYAGELGII